MAYGSSDQHIKQNKDLQIKKDISSAYQAGIKAANEAMQIAAHPSDPYKADKYEREYLDGLYKNLQIKKEAGKDPVDVFKDGIQGEFDLSKGPVLPNFKPMGREIKGVREGVLPLKDTKIKQQLQIGPQAGASSRQIRDRLKPFTRGGPADYDKEGGSLRDVPDSLRPILLRDAMAQNLPANNIRRLQDTGHMTIPQNPDGTGPLRIIDLLGPQSPPQANIDLGGGRSLGTPEVKFLREIFPGASEKEKNRLIKMYGTGWMKAESPANNIKSTWPWRTRPKKGTGYKELYDPVTGMSQQDFKA